MNKPKNLPEPTNSEEIPKSAKGLLRGIHTASSEKIDEVGKLKKQRALESEQKEIVVFPETDE